MTKKINVLCAMRDTQMARRLQREMDDGEHLSIEFVVDGEEAYDSACRFRPDILVLDAVLSGMDGPGLVDRLRKRYGGRMPRVIGGAMMPFARNAFLQRGVEEILCVPWNRSELRAAILLQMESLEAEVDWEWAQAPYIKACALLSQIGMRESLKGYTYLAWTAALAYSHEARLASIGDGLYRLVAARFATTPQSVERLIRHAVESTMDAAKAGAVYGFFGNTIDPTRGKPTNAQMLALLLEKMKMHRE